MSSISRSLYADLKKRMDHVIDHLRHELAGVRTGRATINILDPVHVDAYGSRMPLEPGRDALGS